MDKNRQQMDENTKQRSKNRQQTDNRNNNGWEQIKNRLKNEHKNGGKNGLSQKKFTKADWSKRYQNDEFGIISVYFSGFVAFALILACAIFVRADDDYYYDEEEYYDRDSGKI